MPQRKITGNKYLVDSYSFSFDNKKTNRKLDKEELSELIRQKPNRKIFGIYKFHLNAYLLVPPEKVERKNKVKKERLKLRNEKRIAKGKDTLTYSNHWTDWLRNTVGEKPVIFDKKTTDYTTSQLNKYLFNHGYFNSEVTYDTSFGHKPRYHLLKLFNPEKADSLERSLRNNLINIEYQFHSKQPYTIDRISFSIDDLKLLPAVKKASKNTLLRNGENYNVDHLDAERDRLTIALRDLGYYRFNNHYITFKIDSALNEHKVQIDQQIQNRIHDSKDSSDLHHKKYRIRTIYVNTNFNSSLQEFNRDTLIAEGLHFINAYQLSHSPDVISRNIFLSEGNYYSQSAEEYTQKRLAALKNFKFIDINFQEDHSAGSDTLGLLDCTINLTPAPRQSLTLEAEGTNRSSNLGILGNILYSNKNIFRGAERLEVRLKGGVEAQQTSNVAAGDGETVINDVLPFNTVELGGQVTLKVPELIFPKKVYSTFNLPNFYDPVTNINLQYNFQQRPDFTRNIANTSLSYSWTVPGKNTNYLTVYPINFSLIEIVKTESFQDRLDKINNPFLSSSYNNQLISSSSIEHVWTNKLRRKNKNFTFNRIALEFAGNILSSIHQGSNQEQVGGDHYEVFGIRYAQFAKVDNDLKFINTLTQRSTMIYRFYAGIGIPYGNLDVLPFEKSFFGGGTNDIRAWQARTLGPGSVSDTLNLNVDQVGDIILQGNFEYRAKLFKYIEGAAFIDLGNIWLLNEDPQRPGGHFEVEKFISDIAVGGGLGIRLDFSFMIIRFDAGLQIRDPSLAEDERWLFQKKQLYKQTSGKSYSPVVNFNLGIGYPF